MTRFLFWADAQHGCHRKQLCNKSITFLLGDYAPHNDYTSELRYGS